MEAASSNLRVLIILLAFVLVSNLLVFPNVGREGFLATAHVATPFFLRGVHGFLGAFCLPRLLVTGFWAVGTGSPASETRREKDESFWYCVLIGNQGKFKGLQPRCLTRRISCIGGRRCWRSVRLKRVGGSHMWWKAHTNCSLPCNGWQRSYNRCVVDRLSHVLVVFLHNLVVKGSTTDHRSGQQLAIYMHVIPLG